MSAELAHLGREVRDPEPGVDYTGVLTADPHARMRGAIGVLLAFTGYALVVPVVAQMILGLTWLVRARPGVFSDYYAQALAYELPEGLLAGHVALALLTPLALLLVRWWHHTRAGWASSVVGRLRWRYLLWCLPLAALTLNAMLWLTRLGHGAEWSVPAQAWLWLLLIVALSPLQAAAEEYLFRGYLMQALGAATGRRWAAIVASSLIFAAMHGVQNVWLFADRFAFGLLAGWLVVVTGGLEAGIAAHVANNVFAFGYALFQGGVARARAVQRIGWQDALADVAGFALTALVAWWLARRMSLADRTPTDLSNAPVLP